MSELYNSLYKKAREENLGASNHFLKYAKGGVAPFKQNCLSCYELRGNRYNQEVVQGILKEEKDRTNICGDRKFAQFLIDSCNGCFKNNVPTYLAYLLSQNLHLNPDRVE